MKDHDKLINHISKHVILPLVHKGIADIISTKAGCGLSRKNIKFSNKQAGRLARRARDIVIGSGILQDVKQISHDILNKFKNVKMYKEVFLDADIPEAGLLAFINTQGNTKEKAFATVKAMARVVKNNLFKYYKK